MVAPVTMVVAPVTVAPMAMVPVVMTMLRADVRRGLRHSVRGFHLRRIVGGVGSGTADQRCGTHGDYDS
jgi:hypothetical protein